MTFVVYCVVLIKMFFQNRQNEQALIDYVKNVKTIVKRNFFIKHYGHLQTTTKIRRANSKTDYLYDESFNDKAFVVDWKFTDNGCTAAVCFPFYKPASTCKPDTHAHNISDNVIACQPACYALSGILNPNYARWIDHKCVNIDARAVAIMQDAALRPNPTGRDTYTIRVDFPDASRQFVAHVDADYCNQFGMILSEHQCKTTEGTMGYVVSFFTGESLIKMYRLSTDRAGEAIMKFISSRESNTKSTFTNTVPEYMNSIKSWKSNVAATNQNEDLQMPISLNRLGIIDDNREWIDGKIVFKRKRRETVRQVVDNVVNDVIENPYDLVSGIMVDHVISAAKKHVTKLKKIAESNSDVLLRKYVNGSIISHIQSATIKHMTADVVATQTSKMIAISSRLSTAALTGVGILSIVGPVLDLFWATCWDPMHMTFKPLDDNDLRNIIQTSAVNMWKNAVPLEYTPEYAWDNYYGRDIDIEEIMYTTISVAIAEYVSSIKSTAMGSSIINTNAEHFYDTVINYPTLPDVVKRALELRNLSWNLTIVGTCMMTVMRVTMAKFLCIMVIVTILLVYKTFNSISEYYKNMGYDYDMSTASYII